MINNFNKIYGIYYKSISKVIIDISQLQKKKKIHHKFVKKKIRHKSLTIFLSQIRHKEFRYKSVTIYSP